LSAWIACNGPSSIFYTRRSISRHERGRRTLAGRRPSRFCRLMPPAIAAPLARRRCRSWRSGAVAARKGFGLRTTRVDFDDPTAGVRAPKFRSAGFYTWSEEDIAAFEARHPIGSQARLADVIHMGRQHVRGGLIHIRQRKTGTTLAIPAHPDLRAALDATPAEHLTFLTTRDGRRFTPISFTHWFKHKCREAGLPARASVHGLRKAACRRLAELGCSASVIAAISGHSTLREVSR